MIGVIGATGACQYYVQPASLAKIKLKAWLCPRYFYPRDREKSTSFTFIDIIFLAMCRRLEYLV